MANGKIDRKLPSRIFMYDVTPSTTIVDNGQPTEAIKNLIDTYATIENSTVILNVVSNHTATIVINVKTSSYHRSKLISYYASDNVTFDIIKMGSTWKKVSYQGTLENF